MKARVLIATLVVLVGGLTASVALHRLRVGHAGASRAGAPEPTAGSAAVGPLFQPATDVHGCTASVVDSPSRDLLITAAHCLSGDGAGVRFAPGYTRGSAPYGFWTVVAAYADSHWRQGQDQRYDFAVLRVAADESGRQVQDRVGANRLPSGARTVPAVVHVVGYAAGRDDDAVTCDTTATDYDDDATSPFLEFDCAGFASGTSGSPWLTAVDPASGAASIVGVIGGLDAGGCTDAVSYSPRLGAPAAALVVRAETGDAPDEMPAPPSDGC